MSLETIKYADDKSIKIRKDGFLEMVSLQLCCLNGKKDDQFNRWIMGKDVKSYIAYESKILKLLGNDTEIPGIYRGKKWDPTSKAKGILEYYTDDGNNQSIVFIHRKLAYYYTILKNPLFASWVIDIVDRHVNGDLTLIPEIVENHDKNNEVTTQKIELTTVVDLNEQEESRLTRKRKEREDINFDLEIEEKRLAIEEKRIAIEEKRMNLKKISVELDFDIVKSFQDGNSVT
jgi:hypothetical protein